MRNKRLWAATLAMMMTVVALTGCKGEAKEPAQTPDTSASSDSSETEVGTETEVEAESETEEVEPEYATLTAEGEPKDCGSVVIVDGVGYEKYVYREENAVAYADAVNTIAKNLEGKASVYSLLVPLGSGIVLPDNISIQNGDQKGCMENIFGMMDDSVNKVNVYRSLMEHRDEYLYFRTDHHWTQLGAYYAYEDWCEAKGITPEALDSYETIDFDYFVGSFYNDTEEAVLKDHADVITAYYPHSSSSMDVTPSSGDPYKWKVIFDVSNYKAGIKYSCFIAGDNPYSVIHNNDITDGSSCVVVKESYGNAFVPFLVDHYQTIYVVDYRYYKENILDLVDETGATDVIFVNNLTAISNKYLMGQLQKMVK